MRLCICQICQCGRHRCSVHEAKGDPFAKGHTDVKPQTETKERYRAFGAQPRRKPVLPPLASSWKGTEPTVKSSMTKDDFIPYGLTKKRSLMRPKLNKVAEPGSKMADSTTYGKDFQYMPVAPIKGKKLESHSEGTMPGTMPGHIEGVSTYGRSFTPKPVSRRKAALPQTNNLHVSTQPFMATSETMRRYQTPTITRREPAKPRKGELTMEGNFEGQSTSKTDYPMYPKQELTKSCKKVVSWTPQTDKFEGQSMYKSQFKLPVQVGQPEKRIPKSNLGGSEEPFEGTSAYKSDFPAYPTPKRMHPSWIPSRLYKPPTVPMVGSTSYKRDFLSPPEDVLCSPQKSRPLKGNLTCAGGPMENRTTQMRDFPPILNPEKTKSFKPQRDYQKPEGEILDQSMTAKDYKWKDGVHKLAQFRQKDNLVPDTSPMDDLSTTMKDFQWLCIDCPAAYIKNLGKEALPQFQFEKVVGGHEYFKKLKKLKNIC